MIDPNLTKEILTAASNALPRTATALDPVAIASPTAEHTARRLWAAPETKHRGRWPRWRSSVFDATAE